MNYNDGISFGYDQIFVNPSEDFNGFRGTPAKRNPVEEDLIKKIHKFETSKPEILHTSHAADLPHRMGFSLHNDPEKESLRRAFIDLQRKNDMLTMFIVFLVVFVILHYNTMRNNMMYYCPMANNLQNINPNMPQ